MTSADHGRKRRAHSRDRGFTLLELMVALTVGGIAISSIYAIGSASTRQFHTQQQIANAQTAVRMALNQVKRDVSRAGYLFTPGATLVGQSCAPPSVLLHNPPAYSLGAIARFVNDVSIDAANNNQNVDPTDTNAALANGTSVDDITLMGNYETANEYSGIALLDPINRNNLSIARTSQAMREDFVDWYGTDVTEPFIPAAFQRVFSSGRLIRIRSTSGVNHFARVTGVATNPGQDPEIRFAADPVPAGCSVNNGTVAPISAIRYFVQNAPTDTLDAQRNQGHGPIAQLWRQEVSPADKVTPLPDPDADPTTGDPGAPRRIADYVVGFNLDFTMSTETNLNARDNYVIGALTTDAATINTNPERIRAVRIDLAVRTPEQDPGMPWSTDATLGCVNLRCFQVFADRPGAARVRRMHAEIFVPNVASAGY